MAKEKMICPCKKVSRQEVLTALAKGARDYKDVKRMTGAGSKCGHCKDEIKALIKEQRKRKKKGAKAQAQPAQATSVAPGIALRSVVLDSRDIGRLADFYSDLLGWTISFQEEGWVDLRAPQGSAMLSLQHADGYQPAGWPPEGGGHPQQAHIDFVVQDRAHMDQYVNRALVLGATKPQEQFGGDQWVTLLDPDGHPFCLVLEG